MAHRLTRVRALANLNEFSFGQEALVDEGDPDVSALIDGGWLERLDKAAPRHARSDANTSEPEADPTPRGQ